MSLTKPQTTGPGKTVKFKRRKQERNKRRLMESVDQDWARWDAAAARAGICFAEFARRALNLMSAQQELFPAGAGARSVVLVCDVKGPPPFGECQHNAGHTGPHTWQADPADALARPARRPRASRGAKALGAALVRAKADDAERARLEQAKTETARERRQRAKAGVH